MLDVTGRMHKIITVRMLEDDDRVVTTVEGLLFSNKLQIGEFSVTFDGELVNRKGKEVEIIINNQQELAKEHIRIMQGCDEMAESMNPESIPSHDGLNVTEMTGSSKEIA